MRSFALRRFLQKTSENLTTSRFISEDCWEKSQGACNEQRPRWLAGIEVFKKAVASPQWLELTPATAASGEPVGL
jgi:hypothetical protein